MQSGGYSRHCPALRSSCQTELAERFPEHLVCKWLGNSQRIADQYYLVMRDEDFANAAETECSALQKAVQHTGRLVATACKPMPKRIKNRSFFTVLRLLAKPCERFEWAILDSNQ